MVICLYSSVFVDVTVTDDDHVELCLQISSTENNYSFTFNVM